MRNKARGWQILPALFIVGIAIGLVAQQGKLNLKASPKIVTRNGEEAEISVGKEKYPVLYQNTPRYAESSSLLLVLSV